MHTLACAAGLSLGRPVFSSQKKTASLNRFGNVDFGEVHMSDVRFGSSAPKSRLRLAIAATFFALSGWVSSCATAGGGEWIALGEYLRSSVRSTHWHKGIKPLRPDRLLIRINGTARISKDVFVGGARFGWIADIGIGYATRQQFKTTMCLFRYPSPRGTPNFLASDWTAGSGPDEERP